MATIKAGTYRFNEDLTLVAPTYSTHLEYTVNIRRLVWDSDANDSVYITQEQNGYMLYIAEDSFGYYTDVTDAFVYDADGGWDETQADVAKVITITHDQEIPDEFYEWLIANTKRLSTITYNGSTIASILGGQTATLKCAGLKMQSDVVFEVAEESSDGSCNEPHVIEVDELPTENIDENAVYSCGGGLYKWVNKFEDFIAVYGTAEGDIESLVELYGSNGAEISLNIIPTKTTEGILESNLSTIFHLYYIEDENDTFMYTSALGTPMWVSTSMLGMANGGAISSIDEITETGCYYAVIVKWASYFSPTGKLSITENGTYNVKDKSSVIVDVVKPQAFMVQSVAELPDDALEGSLAIVLGG